MTVMIGESTTSTNMCGKTILSIRCALPKMANKVDSAELGVRARLIGGEVDKKGKQT